MKPEKLKMKARAPMYSALQCNLLMFCFFAKSRAKKLLRKITVGYLCGIDLLIDLLLLLLLLL